MVLSRYVQTCLRKLKQTIPIRRDRFVIAEFFHWLIIADSHIFLMLTFYFNSWRYYARTPLKSLAHDKFVQPDKVFLNFSVLFNLCHFLCILLELQDLRLLFHKLTDFFSLLHQILLSIRVGLHAIYNLMHIHCLITWRKDLVKSKRHEFLFHRITLPDLLLPHASFTHLLSLHLEVLLHLSVNSTQLRTDLLSYIDEVHTLLFSISVEQQFLI